MQRAIIAAIISIILLSCDKQQTQEASTTTTQTSSAAYYIDSETSLPECTSATEGALYYVASVEYFVVCVSGQYSQIDLTGADGVDGKDGIDGTNGNDGEKGEQGEQGIAGTNGNDGADGKDGSDGTMSIKDNNNVVLGQVLSATIQTISIMADMSYMYYLDWNGKVTAWTMYFENNDCTGKIYISTGSQAQTINGKFVYRRQADNQLYVAKSLNADNTAILESIQTGSYETTLGNCVVSTSTAFKSELETIDNISAGIPEISAPLQLIFNE